MSKEFIKIFIPRVPQRNKIRKYLKEIDTNRIYSNFGPLVVELEKRLSTYLGVSPENVVLVSNATQAIEAVVRVTESEQAWVVPSWTFIATGSAVLNAGSGLRLVDVGLDWWTKGHEITQEDHVIDVAPFGDSFRLLSEYEGCKMVIVDCAASFDSLKEVGKNLNSKNICIVLSLHATKLLAAGEGGVIISRDMNLINQVRMWQNFGFRFGTREVMLLGTNAKMNEYSAALGLASLDEWSSQRDAVLELLDWARTLSANYGLGVQPSMQRELASPYWVVHSSPNRIRNIKNVFSKFKIETRMWWGEGLHKTAPFHKFSNSDFNTTDDLVRGTLGLPFHTFLTKEDKCKIKKAIDEAMRIN